MPRKILERSRPTISILDYEPENVLEFLREQFFKQNVTEAYVFGSFAKAQCSAWSDLDLVAVMQTECSFLDRPREFASLFELGVAIDLLVYTPEEFKTLRNNGTSFWQDFEQNHIRII